jgi:PAS domain S-box-containing protein/putative nucleotidyltransferase with HDIG domain
MNSMKGSVLPHQTGRLIPLRSTPRAKYLANISGEMEGFLSSIFASIQDGMSIMDLKLNILEVNPAMKQWYPHAIPLVGKKCYQAYQGQNEPCRPCPAHRAIITGQSHSETIARRRQNGKISGWFEVHSFPWRSNHSGKVQGVINYVRDITYRLQVEDEIENSLKKIQKTLNGTVIALSSIIETRDPYTAGHQKRVVKIASAIAQEMGFSQNRIDGLKVMGFLHDIGKMAIPAEILCKPSKLNEFELSIIKAHPQIAYDILKEIEFPWPVAQTILQHHERLDGSGYPAGLADSDILPEAKILAVADVTEAIASHRPYRPALGLKKALEEISRNQGRLYDQEVVEACLKVFKGKKFDFE